jgi:hypothetical protein
MKMNKMGMLSLVVWANLFASSISVTSDVTTNTTWNADTVFLNKADFTVQSGARLTILPGTAVKFKPNLRFITVRGTISAIGAENDSIRFSKEDTRISWQGIRLLNRVQSTAAYESSYFKFCVLEGTQIITTDSMYMKRGAAVYCGAGNYVEISNSAVLKNGGYHGGAVYVDSGAAVLISKCFFGNNTTNFFGGGAILANDNGEKKLLIQNCRFDRNYARTGGAVRIGKGTKAEINNCIFYRDSTYSINPDIGDLRGGAMAIFGPADVTLRNCIIFHCRSYGKGGGIYSVDASPKLINCTVASNTSVYGGGIYFARDSAASSPLLINTIEGGNGTFLLLPRDSAGCGIFLDSSVTPIFRYCQLYDTVHDFKIRPYAENFINTKYYKTNFVSDMPGELFTIDTVVAGYQLYSKFSKHDPAIDGGTPDTTGLGLPEFDILGQKRIDGSAVDIGAIEFHGELIVRHFPAITKQSPEDGALYEVVIYSLNGQKQGCFTSNVLPHTIGEFLNTKFPRGIYLVAVNRPGSQSMLEKVLVK